MARIKSVLIAWLVAVATAQAAAAQSAVEIPAEDRNLNANFEEVFRIGSIAGEAWETFAEVSQAAFDASGNLYVFDRQGDRITVVDPEGNFVREVGRSGQGPGEFNMAVSFTAMPDGRLVVADLGHRSYQIFDADGEFDRLVSMGGDLSVIRMGDLSPHPTRNAVISGGGGIRIATQRGGGGGRGGPPEMPTGRPIDVVDLSGEQVATSTLVEAWEAPPGEPQTMSGGGMSMRMAGGPRTFEPGLYLGALPNGGVAYVDSTTYDVKVVDGNGRLVRTIHRPFSPRPVTERVEEDEKERQLAELEEGGGPQVRMVGPGGAVPQSQIREMLRNRVEQMQFYEELSVVTALRTSWSGKIWVERRGEEVRGDGPIDVLTDEGRYVGSFEAGAIDMPIAFGPDGLTAFVELDDFDVPSVIVRRLPPVLN